MKPRDILASHKGVTQRGTTSYAMWCLVKAAHDSGRPDFLDGFIEEIVRSTTWTDATRWGCPAFVDYRVPVVEVDSVWVFEPA